MSRVLERKKDTIRIPARLLNQVEVRADTFNEDSRTVEIIWAAGARVKRYSWDEGYYMEELSMDPKHIRMDRFNTGMSFLDSHDGWSMNERLGVVVPGSVRIEGGKAYAVIQLSRKARAEDLLQDLRDGMPFPVSVGYKIHAYEKTEGDDGQLPVLRAVDWEPFELSAVPIPADSGASSRSKPDENTITVTLSHENRNAARDAARDGENEMPQPNQTGRKPGEENNPGAAAGRSAGEIEELERRPPARRPGPLTVRRIDGSTYTIKQPDEQQVRSSRIRPKANWRRELAERYGFEEMNIDDFVERTEGMSELEVRSAMQDVLATESERVACFPQVETWGLRDEGDTRRAAITNAILHRYGVVRELTEAGREWRGMPAMEIVRASLRAQGESDRGSANEVVKRALHTTSDFPLILGDVTRHTLMAGYTGYQNTFPLIATRRIVSDFKEVNVLEMGQGPDLLPVNEAGEFKSGTMKESKEGFKIGTFGRIFGLTRQMIINDQLGAFTDVIQNWGQKAAKLEGDVVWNIIINNAKLKSDGKALFHADHGNLGAAAALSLDALKGARTMFRKQKDIDGNPINIAPQYLFVGSDLEIDAQSILTGVNNPTSVGDVVPQAIKSITPVYEHRLDLISPTVWFLFASMQQTMGRGLQYAYLSGQEQPFFDEEIGFDVDGIRYKIRHDFGAGVTDYRFGYKNEGAAQA